jgi:hypothetical protein
MKQNSLYGIHESGHFSVCGFVGDNINSDGLPINHIEFRIESNNSKGTKTRMYLAWAKFDLLEDR